LVRTGRVLGVRLDGSNLLVGVIETGGVHLRWLPADKVLTQVQAEWWAKTSTFRRSL
jgi:hypothetical protein